MTLKNLFAVLFFAGILVVTGSTFNSCSKDSGNPTQKDTVYLTRTQVLVQNPWEVDELIHVISGQYSSYIRGGANNTGIPYDNLRFTFKADGTGTNIDQFGVTNTTNWHFSTTDQRTISITVNSGTPITYTWNMVELAGNYLHATAGPLTVSGNSNNMESFRLIQVATH